MNLITKQEMQNTATRQETRLAASLPHTGTVQYNNKAGKKANSLSPSHRNCAIQQQGRKKGQQPLSLTQELCNTTTRQEKRPAASLPHTGTGLYDTATRQKTRPAVSGPHTGSVRYNNKAGNKASSLSPSHRNCAIQQQGRKQGQQPLALIEELCDTTTGRRQGQQSLALTEELCDTTTRQETRPAASLPHTGTVRYNTTTRQETRPAVSGPHRGTVRYSNKAGKNASSLSPSHRNCAIQQQGRRQGQQPLSLTQELCDTTTRQETRPAASLPHTGTVRYNNKAGNKANSLWPSQRICAIQQQGRKQGQQPLSLTQELCGYNNKAGNKASCLSPSHRNCAIQQLAGDKASCLSLSHRN
ncbi:LOW QUALITY PROTEIN: hypothetical protein PoB_007676800, partial [Plakobranchus ocellatus]